MTDATLVQRRSRGARSPETKAEGAGFGPGFVAAGSAADPTTVGTLAVVGATTTFALSWVVVLLVPMMAVVYSIAASIGAATSTSIQGAIRSRYGLAWASIALVSIAAISIVTLTADVEAAGASLTLLTGIPYRIFIIPFVVLIGWLLVAHRFARIERWLSLLPLAFLAYGVSAVLAHADWGAVFHAIFKPQFQLDTVFAGGALALIGTTLTSYQYVWESVQVAARAPNLAGLRMLRFDALLGTLVACTTFLFILVATGATLGVQNIAVVTAADAASALRPLAGPFASIFFGIGLLGSAVLAVPVIVGSTGYAVAQTFGWKGTLDAPWREARPFYAVMLGSLALAAVLALAGVPPIALLYGASIAAGIAGPVTLCFTVLIARDAQTMGAQRIGPGLAAAGWIVTAIVTFASIAYITLQTGAKG